jgi:hypothetical protein
MPAFFAPGLGMLAHPVDELRHGQVLFSVRFSSANCTKLWEDVQLLQVSGL